MTYFAALLSGMNTAVALVHLRQGHYVLAALSAGLAWHTFRIMRRN